MGYDFSLWMLVDKKYGTQGEKQEKVSKYKQIINIICTAEVCFSGIWSNIFLMIPTLIEEQVTRYELTGQLLIGFIRHEVQTYQVKSGQTQEEIQTEIIKLLRERAKDYSDPNQLVDDFQNNISETWDLYWDERKEDTAPGMSMS